VFNFKQDLTDYMGQQGNTSIGGSTGSQVNPSFAADIQTYKSEGDTSPIVAKTVEYNKVVENTNKKIAEQKQTQQSENKPYDPTGKTVAQVYAETGRQNEVDKLAKQGYDPSKMTFKNEIQHAVAAPDKLKESKDIEIDYANEDLSKKDFTYVKEGTRGGQCAVFAENVAKLPDGRNWVVGDTIQEKKNSLNQYRNAGLGFLPGEENPQAGNAVIINPGTKWGHVAVVNSVNDDGTITLTESNWNWDERVTHSRKMRLDDPSIVGYIRTK